MNTIYLWLMPALLFVQFIYPQSELPNNQLTSIAISSSGFSTSHEGNFHFSVGQLHTELNLAEMDRIAVDPTKTELENNEFLNVAVYPNPFVNHLQVVVDELHSTTERTYDYTILNSAGYAIQSGHIDQIQQEITFTNIPRGVYVLTLSTNQRIMKSIKLLKK